MRAHPRYSEVNQVDALKSGIVNSIVATRCGSI
jgi:hypothetical protein